MAECLQCYSSMTLEFLAVEALFTEEANEGPMSFGDFSL